MLQIAMTERVGLVNDLLKLLMESDGVNLAWAESLTTEQDRTHEITLILDLRGYRHHYDSFSGDRKFSDRWHLPGMVLNILSSFMNDLKRTGENEPRLSIRRMNFLHQAWKRLTRTGPETAVVDDFGTVGPSVSTGPMETYETVITHDYRIIVPRGIIDTVENELAQRGELGAFDAREVVLFSDTEEKYLSLYFPHPADQVQWLRIPCSVSGIKVVEDITRIFRQKGWNILGSHTNISKSGASVTCTLDIIVNHTTKEEPEDSNLAMLKSDLESKGKNVLADDILMKWYDSTSGQNKLVEKRLAIHLGRGAEVTGGTSPDKLPIDAGGSSTAGKKDLGSYAAQDNP